MSSLRVVMVVGGFPTAEAPNRCIFNRNAAENLAALVDVTVVFLRMWRPGRRLVSRELRSHGPLVTVAVPSLPWSALRVARRTVVTFNTNSFRNLGGRLLRKELSDADLLHSVGVNLPGVVSSSWSRRFACAHVAQCMGSDVNSVMPKIKSVPGVRGWERGVDGVACNSEALVRAMLDLCPDLPNVRAVYRGVDLSAFNDDGPADGPLAGRKDASVRFLYLGGLPDYPGLPWGRDTKGGVTLMSAWRQAEERLTRHGAVLQFAGPDADLPRTRAWRDSLQHPERVAVLSAVPPQEVPGNLRSADVVLLPSREEGLPNVAMEASACGRPVIGTDVGGTPEVVENGMTGWIVRPGSPQALAAAMTEAASDRERLRRLGAAARLRMERLFDRRRYAPAMMELYRAALAERGIGRR